jgi:hypothetical protein
MLFSMLFNLKSATKCQNMALNIAIVDECFLIDWYHSDLYLPASTPLQEQSKDYSSNLSLIRKNTEFQPKSNSGRYKTKLVVPKR